MLELRSVSKSYDGVAAVEPTDLVIPSSRTTVLLGPSGCGKSTLLRVMLGLLGADTGSVWLDGVLLSRENALRLRRRMGYVVQDGGLFPHLTARGNVVLMARYLGWEARRIDRCVGELAALTQFPPAALDRYPAELSGGQRQRVSLMRALMMDPEVLLLDEPLGALDPMIRSDLQTQLKTVFGELRKTVVLVTHDIGEAGFLGDDIVLLQKGRIVQRGSLRELVDSPADPFVSRFINAQHSPLDSLAGGLP